MRNRLIGCVAFVFGLGALAMILTSNESVDISVYVIFPIFLLVGAWQLFTGKSMASLTDFIFSGKITKDERQDKGTPEQVKFNQNNPHPHPQQSPDYIIVDIFLEDCRRLLPSNTQHLLIWKNNEDISALKEIHKNLHTVIGGAHFCESPNIADVARPLQRLITALINKEIDNKEVANKFLTTGNDIIVTLVGRLENRQPLIYPTKYLDLLQQFLKKRV